MSKALAVGAALLLASVVWRAIIAKQRRARVLEALGSADPSVRTLALRRISRSGVGPYAAAVAGMVAAEADPIRRGELAWVIASTQWEPARDPTLVQLRLWADDHYRKQRRDRLEASVPTFQLPAVLALPALQAGASTGIRVPPADAVVTAGPGDHAVDRSGTSAVSTGPSSPPDESRARRAEWTPRRVASIDPTGPAFPATPRTPIEIGRPFAPGRTHLSDPILATSHSATHTSGGANAARVTPEPARSPERKPALVVALEKRLGKPVRRAWYEPSGDPTTS